MQPPENAGPDWSPAEYLARQFHEAYENLAPDHGYETRGETREFDHESKNGKLMIATCQRLLDLGIIEVLPRRGSTSALDKAEMMEKMLPTTGRAEMKRAQQQIEDHHKRHQA